MLNKNLLIFPGNNRIDEPSHKIRYELIRTMCNNNGYNMLIINYLELLSNEDFNISNLINCIKPSIILKNLDIIFGISYGCNLLLRLMEIDKTIFPKCNRISIWGAYPYWYYHKSLITEGIQTKEYLKNQGFKIQPEDAMRLEKPIEEMLYNHSGNLDINLGWGTNDLISTTVFNQYLSTLNKKIKMYPIKDYGHIIDTYDENYERLIFGP